MVLYHIQSQRTQITQHGKPSAMMGTPMVNPPPQNSLPPPPPSPVGQWLSPPLPFGPSGVQWSPRGQFNKHACSSPPSVATMGQRGSRVHSLIHNSLIVGIMLRWGLNLGKNKTACARDIVCGSPEAGGAAGMGGKSCLNPRLTHVKMVPRWAGCPGPGGGAEQGGGGAGSPLTTEALCLEVWIQHKPPPPIIITH